MRYRLIITPDNSDPSTEDFATMADATKRAATLIRDYEPTWPSADIAARMIAGEALSYHDYSEIRVDGIRV